MNSYQYAMEAALMYSQIQTNSRYNLILGTILQMELVCLVITCE